jgi:hypothetical protein
LLLLQSLNLEAIFYSKKQIGLGDPLLLHYNAMCRAWLKPELRSKILANLERQKHVEPPVVVGPEVEKPNKRVQRLDKFVRFMERAARGKDPY